jgi:3-oxoacyl-[acyl-carrier protein] reductase
VDLGLQSKVAIVTGGATGIGRAIVLELAREGALVCFTSRDEDSARELYDSCLQEKLKVHYIKADPVPVGGVEKIYSDAMNLMGRVDIVVNNVGDTLGILDPECSITDWRNIFRLNLEVHIELNNLVIPQMRSRKWGRIVNITAGAGLENSGPVPYSSIKAAYTAYTRSMARVIAQDGIVMSAVLPGVVFTERGHWQKVLDTNPAHAEKYLQERTVLKRFGKPEEISPFVALLCSELASFAVGSIVPVEGGQARHFFAGNIESYA